jgi:hypothetical protein
MDDVMLGRLPHQPEPNEVNRPQLCASGSFTGISCPSILLMPGAHFTPLAHFPILPGGRGLTE